MNYAPNVSKLSASRRRQIISTAVLTAAVAGVTVPGIAMAGLTFTGSTLTENFDSLPSTTPLGTNPNSGSFATLSSTVGAQLPVPQLTTWDVTKNSGSGSTPMNLSVDSGSLNSGALYSYGAPGSTDRSLGALASGSNAATVGVAITNNSAFAMTSFTLSFTAEQWRSSTSVQNVLSFAYGVSGTGSADATNYLTDASMTTFTALDAPGQAPVTANAATDGTLAANQTHVTATVTANVPIGATLFLRWADLNDVGNDAGIGIDDWSFSAVGGGRNLTWNPGSTTWNTTNTNWLNGASPSNYANGDSVNFTDTGVGAVNVDAGGLSPGNVTVSNTSGTYTFSGGALGGSGVLTKSGSGTLVLSNTVSMSGGIVVNDGVLSVASDASLGATGVSLSLNGGTLLTTANFSSTRGLSLGQTATSTVDVGAGSVQFSGVVSGTGNLQKNGSGTLIFAGAYNSSAASGETYLNGGTLVLAQPTGTVNLKTGFGGGDFTGNLVVASPIRVNLSNGIFGGDGNIYVKASGAALSTAGSGNTSTISKPIILNPDNLAAPFVTYIGGVGGSSMNLAAAVSGSSDVNFASSSAGGGAATLTISTAMTYSGATLINNGGQTPGVLSDPGTSNPGSLGFPAGTIRLGVNDVFPVTTDVIANTIVLSGTTTYNGPGRIDMNGKNQTFKSLSTGGGSGSELFEITNDSGALSTLTVNGNTTPATAANMIITDGYASGGQIALVKAGTGTLELTGVYPTNYKFFSTIDTPAVVKPYSGGTTVQGGTLIEPNFTHGPLTITGGTARVGAGATPNMAAHTTVVPSLTFGGTTAAPVGKLDVGNSSFIIDYTTGSPLQTVRQALLAGASGGGVNGIVSSSAGTPAGTSVGYGEASTLGISGSFAGASFTGDAVLLKFTYSGDTNLDGKVDIVDLGKLAGKWQQPGVWTDGDVNYDGTVNIVDLGLLAGNWQKGVGSPLGPDAVDFSTALASLGLPNVSVPEPMSLGLIGLGTMGMISRRRRRQTV